MPLKLIQQIETFLTDDVSSTDETNFIARMEAMYTKADAFIDFSLPATSKLYGNPPLCAKGCYYCCHQLLMVSFAEAMFVYLKLNRAKRLAEIMPKTGQRIAILKQKLQKRVISFADINEGQRQYNRFIEEQNALRLPCLFLADDGSCSIHPFRPLTCRDAHVFEGDPKDCLTISNPVTHSVPFCDFYHLLAMGLSKKMWGRTGGGDILLLLLDIHDRFKDLDLSNYY